MFCFRRPLIGGALAHPAERFPSLFGSSKFLRDYPYFLPCSIPATFTLFCWFITYFYLKEVRPYLPISPLSLTN